jgi:hypothetical protein
MAVDVRENILARLVVIVGTMPSIKQVYRNNVDLTEDDLPAAAVLDGDEETDDTSDRSMRPPDRPTLATMTPEIIIFKLAPQVGPDISTLRRELIKLVLYDIELNEQIVKTGRYGNGAIRYLGCQTDLGWERSMFGALKASFQFKYALRPSDL